MLGTEFVMLIIDLFESNPLLFCFVIFRWALVLGIDLLLILSPEVVS